MAKKKEAKVEKPSTVKVEDIKVEAEVISAESLLSDDVLIEADMKAAEKEAEILEAATQEKELVDAMAALAGETEEEAEEIGDEIRLKVHKALGKFKPRTNARAKIIQTTKAGNYINTATREQWVPISALYAVVKEILK